MFEKLLSWLGGILLISALPFLYFATINSGKAAFSDLAVEYEICMNSSACSAEEKAILAELIIDGTDYSSMHQIEWCLGVDTWADASVRRGGWLIRFFMDGGYLFCPLSSQ